MSITDFIVERKALVIGANGFIGRHLSQYLIQEGWAVRGVSRAFHRHLSEQFEWFKGDVCDAISITRAARGCQVVINLACLPLNRSFEKPIEDFKINAVGTLNVLLAARSARVRQVIYTSTAQIYGPANRLPLRETDIPRPASPYASNKLCGEIICTTFSRVYDLDSVVLRLFNVYGIPIYGRARNTAEAIFCRRVAHGLPPILLGNPLDGRDFIHVKDVVRSMGICLDKSLKGEVLNIGTGKLATLEELAELVISLSGEKVHPIVKGDNAPALRIQADVRKAKRVLGFQAKVLLKDGLLDLIEYERSQREIIR